MCFPKPLADVINFLNLFKDEMIMHFIVEKPRIWEAAVYFVCKLFDPLDTTAVDSIVN